MKKKILALPFVISIVGTAIWFFMLSLSWVIIFFQSHWNFLLLGLPIAALIYGYLDHFQKAHRYGDSETLLQEVRTPQKHVHWLLAPWISVWTLIFHFFGASVGRESTAIQMGGSLSETIGRLIRVPVEDRPVLIRMGLAAGFGAAFGAPWTGFVFALESPLLFRKKDWLNLPFYLLASWGAFQWSHLLGLEHSLWDHLEVNLWDFTSLPYFEMGLFFVALAVGYDIVFRNIARILKASPWWFSSSLAGIFIFILTFIVGAPSFNNLGEPLIQSAFSQPATLFDALAKLIFTFVSTVSGMKGGEVTPLMAAGSLFGSWFASQASLMTFQFGAAIGLVSLFSSRLRVPLSGSIMLWEFFDWKIALLGVPILLLTEFAQRQLASKLS